LKILGISAFYHNSAAALVVDGKIISAVEEERFTRKKNDSEFPVNSIVFCLRDSELCLKDLDAIIFYDNPNIKFSRLISTIIKDIPYNFSYFKNVLFQWVHDKLFLRDKIFKALKNIDNSVSETILDKLQFCKHHISHAASAYYPSNLNKAIILVMDGVGEWQTTTIMKGIDGKIIPYKEINFPDSLGLLYSTFTAYLGFKVNSGEYKLMGLSPYGKDKYSELIKKHLIHINSDGSFKLNMKYFDYTKSTKMYNQKFCQLFNREARKNNEELDSFHADIAKSIQLVLEDAILKIVKQAHKELKINNLVMAGGVALNCVANSKIKALNLFENIWIQPASGDAGAAVGSALYFYYLQHNYKVDSEQYDFMKGALLGPSYTNQEIITVLDAYGATYKLYENKEELIKETANLMHQGNVVGWHQGKAEFGPRALGNRSILADPRSPSMQEKVNLKIKSRESFRPFAPAILEEYVEEYFDFNTSPYMLFTSQVKNTIKRPGKTNIYESLKEVRSQIPAITHVDYSARLQTVSKQSNLKFYTLLEQFNELTQCPVLINTSFNIRGEPMVLTPEDSYKCFMMTDMDVLVMEDIMLIKSEQKNELDFSLEKQNYLDRDANNEKRHGTYKNGTVRKVVLREHVASMSRYVSYKSFFNNCDSYIDKKYHLKTDSNGFIQPSKLYEQADLDILFIGGSTTECMYVNPLYRFPYLTGRLIEQKIGKRINSYNSGVSGNTSLHSLILLQSKIFALDMDMIVMMHNQNDFFYLLTLGSYYTGKGTRSIYSGELNEWSNKDEFEEIIGKKLSYDYAIMCKEFSKNLKSFIYLCRARDITPVLMTMAKRDPYNTNNTKFIEDAYSKLNDNYGIDCDEYYKMYDGFNDMIREVANNENCMLVDLAVEIKPCKELFYDTIHLNEAGSVQAARVISDVLVGVIDNE
jgi:carbamoyltransferase